MDGRGGDFVMMRYFIRFAVILSMYHVLCTMYCFSASWPLFRAGAGRTGAPAEEARPALVPQWNFTIQGEFVSSPVVYKDVVYCGGRDGSVWAWDGFTGEPIWQYSASDWVDATPCVSSDTVFVPSRDKYVYAFDRLGGDVKWTAYTGSLDCSSPLLYDGKLYLLSGAPERKAYAIGARDGSIIASYSISQFSFSSIARRENLLYFGTNDGRFSCMNADTGQVQWSVPTRGGIFYSTLACGDDAVYAVSGGDERRLFCLDPGTGDILWQSGEIVDPSDPVSSVVSSVALGEDKVFVASTVCDELKLFAFPLTGTTPVSPLWSTPIGTPHPAGIISSPAVAGNTIYVGSGNGFLYCIDSSSGQYIAPATGALTDTPTGYYLCYSASYSTGIVASPTVSNGRVYVGTSDGNFWALKARQATAISYPDNDETVIGGSEILGTAENPDFSAYRLEYGRGIDPASWTEFAAGTAPVSSGALGAWNAASLDDGVYSIRLSVNDGVFSRAVNRVTLNNAPRPPSGLTVADTLFDGGGNLTLSWNISGDDGTGDNDVAGYRVYKSSSGAGYSLAAEVAKGAAGYTDSSCPAYTTWYYYVTSFDALSESEASGVASGFSLVDGVEITPANGGTVRLESGGLITEVVIEPNTVAETVWVGIRIPESPTDEGIPVSAGATAITREFGVTPAGTKFLKPVTVKIPYRESDIAGMKQENLRIYWFDETRAAWRIVNTSDPLAESGRVWAQLPHFSLYRIMEYLPGREELLNADMAYSYPNPARGGTLAFKYYLGDKADVTVDVYNVAGELIAHIEKTGNPAGIVSEMEWNISGIASGTYIYRIEARSGSKTKAIKKKLAIIH